MELSYEDLLDKYSNEFTEELTDVNDIVNVIDAQKFMSEKDYLVYVCNRLHYWLKINNIEYVCNIYEALSKYVEYNNVGFESFDEHCKIVFTCAKYYMKAVIKIKQTYNL